MSFFTVIADLLANAKTIDTTLPNEASHRVTMRRIKDFLRIIGEQPYPSGLWPSKNEYQGFDPFDGVPTGGTYTLSFTLFEGVTFTTAPIAYNADGATILSAINTAAAQAVPGWTNGDIIVD